MVYAHHSQPCILPLKEQARVTNLWLSERLSTILPAVMAREGFDLWLVSAREYNEDPVMTSLLPAPMLSARRRTLLLFYLSPDGRFEALHLAPKGVGLDEHYLGVWESDKEDQWACLHRVVGERNPVRIGINVAEHFAFGDGLSHSEHELVRRALEGYNLESAERLAVGWLERRSKGEIEAASGNNHIAHSVIAEAFSPRVVHPGVTRALDVAWWIRQRFHDLGVRAWFQPTVSVQRQGEQLGDIGTSPDAVIRPGDLLHCDVGLVYLGLATDTQQHAYVLRLGEQDAPAGLKVALKQGNRLQDIVTAAMQVGLTGNEILAAAKAQAAQANISGRIYSHPIGTHGHGAGPYIGRYDNQDFLPGTGEYTLFDHTLHSVELFAESSVPEWNGQRVKVALEQTVAFTEGQVYYLAGRQTDFHLI